LHYSSINLVIPFIYKYTKLSNRGLVFINLLMAALYDGFIKNKTGIKAHIKEEDPDDPQQPQNNPIKPIVRKLYITSGGGLSSHNDENIIEKKELNIIDVESSPMMKRILQKTSKKNKRMTLSLKTVPNFSFDYPNFTIKYKLNPSAGIITSYLNKFFNSMKFNVFILLCLLVNIVIFAMDRASISSTESFYLEIINFVCTIIFFIEIMVRLILLSPKKFWTNHFDKLDVIIIMMNMGDIIYLAGTGNEFFRFHTSFSSVIKCLKTLRIFRFLVGLKFWKRGSVLFIEMIYALVNTKEFIVLIVILITVGSLIGMESFAYRIRYIGEDEIPEELSLGSAPRLNFDSIGDALMTTTLICLNEEWHVIMYEHMRIIGKKAGCYFISVLLIGEVILIRMFMALFINGVIHSKNIKNLLKVEHSFENFLKSIFHNSQKKENMKKKVLDFLYFWKKNLGKKNETKELKLIKMMQTEGVNYLENSETSHPLKKNISEGDSDHELQSVVIGNHKVIKKSISVHNRQINIKLPTMELEKPTIKKNGFLKCIRQICMTIVMHKYFEKVILATIVISVVFLMIHDPFQSPDTMENKIQFIIDLIVILFFFFEMMLKISAFGLIFSGPKSFILDPWNCFDLFLFIFTVLGTIDTKLSFSAVNFKWCRVFRIFKIIQFNQGLKNATHILFKSIPDLINLLFFYFMNLFVFGIIAINYLKGVFLHCTTIDEELTSHVITKEDCFDYGGDWINRDLNFDNIFNSLSTLFQLSTTEGWIEEMFYGIDYVGNNQNPIKNNHKTMALFYISFFIIANLIVINMFIGILVETYLHQKNLHCIKYNNKN